MRIGKTPFLFFETGSCVIAQAGLEPSILLPVLGLHDDKTHQTHSKLSWQGIPHAKEMLRIRPRRHGKERGKCSEMMEENRK
jgi:hypothetical protein